MKKALLPLLLVVLALQGCALLGLGRGDGPPSQHAQLEGVWENPETLDRHTIRWINGRYTVTRVESSSGERYVVSSSDWRDGVLTWGYHIPSTDYVITLRTERVGPRSLELAWSDSDGYTRDEVLRRVR